MKRIQVRERHTTRALGLLTLGLVALLGCSASQQGASMPTPPEPPTEAPIPSSASAPEVPPPEPPTASTEAADTPSASGTSRTPEAGEPATAAGENSSASADAADSETETGEGESSPGASAGASVGSPAPSGAVMTRDERRAGLNGRLDESLREFDGLILKEQELLDGRREETAANGGGGGSGGGFEGEDPGGSRGRGGLEGAEPSESGEDTDAGSQEQPATMPEGTGGSPDAPPDDSAPVASGGSVGEDPDAADNDRVPLDVGDGRDDDIVARQLREAAMQEEDPALRERLWDEYRTYKAGSQ